MPTFTVPSSYGTLREFNPCHAPETGRFCTTGAWAQSRSKITKSRHASAGPMRPATDTERKRLGVAPAYTNVMVSTNPKAELRATATTAAGKTAYYYSKAYTDRQAAAKWSRVVAVQRDAPALLTRVDKDLAAGRHVGPAMTLRLIMQTGFRNGGDTEADTYGATSLLTKHATVSGDTVRLQFPGKGGVAQDHDIEDGAFARYVEARQKAGHERLFDHSADDTLDYLKTISRGKFKVHDLRTWYGTVYADYLTQRALQGARPTTKRDKKLFKRQIAERVASRLGNTAAVTLSTYIHPGVFSALEESRGGYAAILKAALDAIRAPTVEEIIAHGAGMVGRK